MSGLAALTFALAAIQDLVGRVNPTMLLREPRYDNDSASVRIRLRWAAGTPKVSVLRSCTAGATC